MKRTVSLFAVLAAAILWVSPARAQNHALEYWGASYGITFSQQFLGKVVRGENVFNAFGKALYEAVPSATLYFTGMNLAGHNWRMAIPAQILTQKGAQIQRRSMLGRPLVSRELLTSWELEYLWFNFRLSDGRLVTPRVNVSTFVSSLWFISAFSSVLNTRLSLTTGSAVYTQTRAAYRRTHGDSVPPWGFHNSNAIVLEPSGNAQVLQHELVHALQYVRANAAVDVLLGQDDSQRRSLPSVRLDLGWLSALAQDWLIAKVGNPCLVRSRFSECEATYHDNTKRYY